MTPKSAGALSLLACALCATAAIAGQRLSIRGAHVDIERRPLTVGGLPVLTRADVTVTRGVQPVSGTTQALLPPPTLVPSVPAAAALAAAERDLATLGIPYAGAARSPVLALLPSPSALELVWVVDGRAPWAGADPVPGVLLDAGTGRMLALWNEVEHFDRARVYDENPVVTPALSEIALGTDSASSSVADSRLRTLNCVDRHDTRSTPLGALHLCHLEPVAARDANGDFLLQPAADSAPEDPFAEVQAFYAARRAWDLFAGYGLSGLSTEPLPLVVNMMLPAGLAPLDLTKAGDPALPLQPYPGAAYRTSSPVLGVGAGVDGPAIWLGQGAAADMAYDSDVVSHELVHAVVDSTVRLVQWMHADDQGLSGSPSALNEGLADYFAGVLGGDPQIGEYAGKNFGLPEWRSIEGPARCPDQLVGEPHADSLIVSRALWAVRSGLAPSQQGAFDEAVFDALVSLPTGEPGFDDFAGRLLDVVDASALAPLPALREELSARGLYPACRRVLEWKGTPLDAPVPGGRYIAPGLYQSPWANNGQPTPLGYAPGIVQFSAEVPPGSSALTVRFQAWDTSEPRVLLALGDRIEFDWRAPRASADRDAVASSVGGQRFEARFDLPPGVARVAAMVVDPDPLAFTYSAVDFAFQPAQPPPAKPASAPALVATGGCSCRAARPADRRAAAALLLGVVGWIAARRKARRGVRGGT